MRYRSSGSNGRRQGEDKERVLGAQENATDEGRRRVLVRVEEEGERKNDARV